MRRIIKSLIILFICVLQVFLPLMAAAEELNVYVDRSDPVISVSGTKLDGSRLIVSGTAYDVWSGIRTVEAAAEGGGFETVGSFETGEGGEWSWIYQVPEDCGRYGRFVFRAVDNAGNTAEISRNDIEIYNKKAALIFPDYVIKNIPVTSEIEGEPVRAVVNVSGHGHDFEEWELTGPDFTLVWDGFIAGIEVPAGSYLLTVRTYNQTGQFTVSNTQAIVPGDSDGSGNEPSRWLDIPISGTVDEIGSGDAVVNGQDLIITPESKADDAIRPGDSVTGIGRYDTQTGYIEVTILVKTGEPERTMPDIEVEGDEKTGEKEFSGIIEAVGPDFIVVEGEVVYATDSTVISCDFSELHPGDYVSGIAEIFSRSGTKALIISKTDTEKARIETVCGHVTAMGDGWVEIDTGNGRYIITDGTIVNGTYEIGTLILIEVLLPENEALKITVLRHAECSEGLSYFYGEVHGIFRDTGELVVGELIHSYDETLTVDDLAGDLEVGAIAAVVDYDCRTVSLRIVQNAGAPRAEDLLIGEVSKTGEKDVNGNTSVYIDGKYNFMNRNTNTGAGVREGMFVTAVRTGEELISVFKIPESSIEADSLTDFAGAVARVTSEDSYGRRYILVNGITYRLLPGTVVSEDTGKLEKGAVIAGTVLGNDIVHAAVIRAKAEDADLSSAFTGTVTAEVKQEGSGFSVTIGGKKYTGDGSSLVYSDLKEGDKVAAVHDRGYLLAVRDFPENTSAVEPVSFTGQIESVSAKNYDGSFTVTVGGKVYTVGTGTMQSGYIAAGMRCLITCIDNGEEGRELVSIIAGNQEVPGSIETATGKVGSIGLADESGNGTILIDGFGYRYSAQSVMPEVSEDVYVIAAVSNGMLLSAAVREEEMIFGTPEPFSGTVEAVSDRQTDGSYIVTVNGEKIALTKATLLNDDEAPLGTDAVLSGIRFGNTVWVAETCGIGRYETSDVAFSGIIEQIDEAKHTVTIRRRVRDAGSGDLSGLSVGMLVAGAIKPGKSAVSIQAVTPSSGPENIEPFSGYIDSVTATDRDGMRMLTVGEDVYFIPDTADISGELKDGSRIAGFADRYSRKIVAVTVAEQADSGGYMEGKIDEITPEHITVLEKKDWYHLILGGMFNLVGDKTVLISDELKTGDKVSGYLFGPERKLLAVLEEDTSLIGRIRNASAAVKAGLAGLGLLTAGSGAALAVGGRKKRFSGVLELESDGVITVKDPEKPSDIRRYRLPKDLYETASLLRTKQVKGSVRFGKVDRIDIDE